MEVNVVHTGDALKKLKAMPDKSVHCIVTSPPYWGMRNYGVNGQIGLEKSLSLFIKKLVIIFREARRVLRDDGTVWVNMGDGYAHTGAAYGNKKSTLNGRRQGEVEFGMAKRFQKKSNNIKPKDLIGVPWLLAFALRDDGWYLRQDIIWSKPNPMPGSMKDRCTTAHEYIFLLSKKKKYYFDNNAISTPLKDSSVTRLMQDVEHQRGSDRVPGKTNGNMKAVFHKNLSEKGQPVHSMHLARLKGTGESDSMAINGSRLKGHSGNYDRYGNVIGNGKANKRSVWEVATSRTKEKHFATFPENLIVDCIKAGCPADGIVLDFFFGYGTTGVVAGKLGRKWIGIELNPKYVKMSKNRLRRELGLFYQGS